MKLELQTNNDTDYIRDILESKLTYKMPGDNLSLDVLDGRLSVEYGDDVDGISSLIADILMEYKFPEYLSLYVKRDYSFVDEYFRSKAFLLTLKYFWCDDDGYRDDIKSKVAKYIYRNGVLNIDGFVCFKLRDCVKQWQNEYEGNIKMLTSAYEGTQAMMELAAYVATRPKSGNTIHISRNNDKYSYGENTKSSDFVYSAKEVFALAIDDLPKSIIYYTKKSAASEELAWVLTSVFGGAVTIIDF